MSYTFDAIDELAFEFAKALVANAETKNLSKEAMKLAEQWHDEQAIRESMYRAKRVKWHDIDKNMNYEAEHFSMYDEHWVADVNGNVYLGEYAGTTVLDGRSQPVFKDVSKEDAEEKICDYFLLKNDSSEISSDTPPIHPNS